MVGATFLRQKDTTPLLSSLLSRLRVMVVSKSHDTATVRAHTPELDTPPGGVEWGWERPPSDLRIYSPEIGSFCRRFRHVRGRSQPAPAARWIPAGRPTTRRRAGGPRCGRRHRATAPRGRSRPRWPEGLRLAEGKPVRRCEVGGTTTVRRCARRAPVREFGGGIPVCPFTGSSSRSPDPSQRRRRPAEFGRFDTRNRIARVRETSRFAPNG